MRKWTTYVALAGVAALEAVQALCQVPGAQGVDFSQAEKQFEQRCDGCHGEGGEGGDRAPALINSRSLRSRNEGQIRDLIKKGVDVDLETVEVSVSLYRLHFL